MPLKCKDMTVSIPFPTVQRVTIAGAGVACPVAGDIGHQVRLTDATFATNGVYIGKLVGYEDATPDVWYILTQKTIAINAWIKVDGGTGKGQAQAASASRNMMYITFGATYTDAVASDVGKMVVQAGPTDVGPLFEYDNDTKVWLVALTANTNTVANGTAMTITGGTGAGTTNAAGTQEITLSVVDGISIELLYEGGMEFLFGQDTGEVGLGPKHATFTIRRWFYDDTDKDLLFDLFNGKISFDLKGNVATNAVIRIRRCKGLRWRPVTGTANDTVAEELIGEAEDWIKATPTD